METRKKKDAFFEGVENALRIARAQKSIPLDKSAKEAIYRFTGSIIHRGDESVTFLVDIFAQPKVRTEWILSERRDLLPAIQIVLSKFSTISHVLSFYVKQVLEVIVKREKESTDLEEIRDLLFAQIEISNEIPEEDYFRGIEEAAIESLSRHLQIEWKFIGKLGYNCNGQMEKVPVLACEVTSHQPVNLADGGKSIIQEIEDAVESGDRYFIFPKMERVQYNLNSDQKKLLYLFGRYLLLKSDSDSKSKAQAVSYLLLQEEYNADVLLLYASSLVDRPVATLSLIEYAITPENPLKEKEHEIMWAKALVGTGSHTAAIPLFEKYKETDQLIVSLICAGKKEIAKPLMEKRIEKLKNEIDAEEITSSTWSMYKETPHSRESVNLLKIELASLLYVLGCTKNSTDAIYEAFNLVKTAKYAKGLCTRLLLENKHEEALSILKECNFEVLDVDTLLLTSLSLAKSKKFEEAERLLRYAEIFNQKNEKIDLALQSILIQQGRVEEALDILLEKIRTYTPNILRDCHILFQCSKSFMMFSYTKSALLELYRKTGQLPAQWMDELLLLAESSGEAKEAFLSVATEIKTLSLAETIEKVLSYPNKISPRTEYYARKRLIEYAIHKKQYKDTTHLARMKSLSSEIDENQDYLDTVYAFYKSQHQR